MTCSLCKKQVPIVYNDSCYSPNLNPLKSGSFIFVNLCYNCLGILGWEIEKKELLPKLRKCPKCTNMFIPKNSNQVKCGICLSQCFHKPKMEEKVAVAPFCF